MRESRHLVLLLAAAICAVGGAGCGETVGPPASEGALVVNTSTTGAEPDADGYSLTLDAEDAGHVGPNASVTFADLSAGSHAVAVGGLAANCQVTGDNPRTVIVAATDTVEVGFAVTCSSPLATVIVETSTSGSLQDPDGYLLSMDGGSGQPVGTHGSLTIDDVTPGSHRFELSEVASNCTVSNTEITAPGSNSVTITVEPGSTFLLRFSVACVEPAVAHLLFTGDAGTSTHIFERRNDGSITDLTPDADGDEGKWSPDGSRIVFTSIRSGTLGIYVMDADGRHVVRLTHNGETSPSWSPDGTKILFWPYVTAGFGEITVMNADGTDVRVLATGSRPAWSPDGTRIAFERAELDACVFDLCALNIYTMAADGTDVRQLTSKTLPFEYAAEPAWSPDGTRIAYLSGDFSGGPTLRVMTSAGASVTALGTVASAPVWSPSGESIAVSQGSAGGSRVVAIPVDGGPVVELVNRPAAFPTSWR